MVAKCANPECNREFRELNKGRLFLLPPDTTVSRLIDYCYWLCPDCAAAYTLEREEDHPGIQVVPRTATIVSIQVPASR